MSVCCAMPPGADGRRHRHKPRANLRRRSAIRNCAPASASSPSATKALASASQPQMRNNCPYFTRKSRARREKCRRDVVCYVFAGCIGIYKQYERPPAKTLQATSLHLKAEYAAGGNVVVVLVVLAGVDVERRHAAPIIAGFESKLQAPGPRQADIKTNTTLEHARDLDSVSCVRSKEH